MHGPLVSCLMVTLPVAARTAFAERSIRAYCAQTYPSRELVLVADGGEAEARTRLIRFVDALGRDDIRLHVTDDCATLGALRNRSLKFASGEIVCQWDDDDLYHPERIERQAALLQTHDLEAVFIQEVLQYYPDLQRMYLTNWRATEVGGHPGTLMARLTAALAYPETGAGARLGEDLSVARDLIARGRVERLREAPGLFVYVSHGANSWHEHHHDMLARELRVSKGLLRRREEVIRRALLDLDLPAGPIGFYGGAELAFTIER
jgi:glycosyltransferase involved in cell wall biosynthesis